MKKYMLTAMTAVVMMVLLFGASQTVFAADYALKIKVSKIILDEAYSPLSVPSSFQVKVAEGLIILENTGTLPIWIPSVQWNVGVNVLRGNIETAVKTYRLHEKIVLPGGEIAVAAFEIYANAQTCTTTTVSNGISTTTYLYQVMLSNLSISVSQSCGSDDRFLCRSTTVLQVGDEKWHRFFCDIPVLNATN